MKINWERLSSIVICVAAGIVLVWFGGRLLLSVLLPFLIAWLLSLCITPLSDRFAKRLRLSPKLCGAVFLTLALSLSVWLIGAAVHRLFTELGALVSRLSDSGELLDALSEPFDYFEQMTSHIGFLNKLGAGEQYAAFRERFNDMMSDLIGNLLSSVSAELPRAAASMLSAMPSALLFLAVTVIAGFYVCMDRQRIGQAVASLLPVSVRNRLSSWRERIKRFSWKYVRAYLFLLLLTFAELFVGFWILRVEYGFLLAVLIAVVDLLPVLGVGTVLVPWAIVALLRHDFYLGFGLLILWLAVMLLRQILEPKLVGKSLGLHPLLTLFAGYAGWKCFGVLGMALGPVVAVLGKSLLSQIKKDA